MKRVFCVIATALLLVVLMACTGEKVKKIDIERLTLEDLSKEEGNIYVSKDEKYSELAEKIKNTVKRKEFPGSLLVATDSRIIFASGTDALQKDGATVSPDTGYQIGSVSKTYAATCVLKLIEEGKLSLDDRLEKFLPECENLKDITIRQLLHMNTGLADVVNMMEKSFGSRGEEFLNELTAGKVDSERLADYLKDIVFIFKPGEKIEYSNTNYLILAIVIEKVTGKSYEEYLRQLIIDPLEMSRTKIGELDSVDCAYTVPDLPVLFTNYPALLKGAGDVTTSVLDMLQFDRALFSGLLINQASLDTMFDLKDGYSCGWMQDNTRSELHSYGNYYWKASDSETVYHAGNIPGFMSFNIVLNKNGERMYLIMLFSAENNDRPETRKAVFGRMNDILKSLS
ncbi:MAG: beta-lactamase family protein [Lachnospiraceae bacterium]|nr:beta-lactamase family protein [Lachnospiraceae bacterium]